MESSLWELRPKNNLHFPDRKVNISNNFDRKMSQNKCSKFLTLTSQYNLNFAECEINGTSCARDDILVDNLDKGNVSEK